jgi:hypothetical protein
MFINQCKETMPMPKISRYLSEWEKAGLLTAQQTGKILEYENSKHKRPWVLYGFIMLGVSVLSIGVISLIAANWSSIPPMVKLAADFILLFSTAVAIYVTAKKNLPLVFDALGTFFVFFFLASIGLLSQIYHTGGELYQALFLVCAVMLPLTLISYKKFLPNVWVVLVLAAVILFCAALIDKHHRENLFFIAFGILLSMQFVSGILGSLSSFGNIAKKLSFPFVFWSVVFFFAVMVYIDINYSLMHRGFMIFQKDVSMAPLYFIINSTGLVLALLIIMNKNMMKKIKIFAVILTLFYCLILNFYLGLFTPRADFYDGYADFGWTRVIWQLIGPAETIIILLLFSLIFSALNYKKLFNAMILLIGIRFLLIYFQVFKSLAYTGMGLIVSGLVIIGFVVVWYKFHAVIEDKIRGLIQ